MIIGEIADNGTNILGNPHPYANYIIDKSDDDYELKVPSGYQTGIKIVMVLISLMVKQLN